MKKTLLILAFLFSCMSPYTQNSTPSLERFGNFTLGMTRNEVKDAIEKHKLADTEIIADEESMFANNIELNGLKYDGSNFAFKENLSSVTFLKKCRTIAGAEREKARVAKSIEGKYGKAMVFNDILMWIDEQNRVISVKADTENGELYLFVSYFTIEGND